MRLLPPLAPLSWSNPASALVACDRLQESGDPLHRMIGEFGALHFQDGVGVRTLFAKEEELVEKIEESGGSKAAVWLDQKGFGVSIEGPSTDAVRAVVDSGVLSSLKLQVKPSRIVPSLHEMEGVERLRALNLDITHFNGPEGVINSWEIRRIARIPFSGLEELRLNFSDNSELESFLRPETLIGGLTTLRFEGDDQIDTDPLRPFLEGHRPRLLDLGLAFFFSADRPDALQALNVPGNLSRLRRLELMSLRLNDQGLRELAANFGRDLRSLNLAGNETVDTEALLDTGVVARLEELNLHTNEIGAAGIRLLADSPQVRNLSWIELGNPMAYTIETGDIRNAMRALSQSRNFNRLAHLGLGNEACAHLLSDYDLALLGESSAFPALASLDLLGWDISEKGLYDFLGSPLGERLKVFKFSWKGEVPQDLLREDQAVLEEGDTKVITSVASLTVPDPLNPLQEKKIPVRWLTDWQFSAFLP